MRYSFIKDDIIKYLYNEISNNKTIYYFISNIHKKILEISNIGYLTSGGLVLFNILNIKNKYNESFSKNDIYVFSFINNDLSYESYHYYKDNVPRKDIISSLNNYHNINNEIIFLRKIFNCEN